MRATTLVGRLIGVENVTVSGFDLVEDLGRGRLVLTARVGVDGRRKPRCGRCERICPGYDTYGERSWRSLDVGTVMVVLVATMVRVSCPVHGVVVAHVSWARPGSRFTTAFEDSVAWLAANMPASKVAALMASTWRAVNAIIGSVVTRAAGRADLLAGLSSIAIDEVAYRKGQRYMTVIVNNDTGALVWAAKGHGKKVLHAFFDALGTDRAAALAMVSSDGAGSDDGWIGRVVCERAPQATRCMDPFHVVAWATEALEHQRRAVLRAMRAAGNTSGLDLLAGTRWALLKNVGTHTGPQATVLAALKDANNELYTGYLLKEQLRAVFNPIGGAGGRGVLAAWLAMADEAALTEWDLVAAKVRHVLPLIRNSIDHRVSNARAEANNTTVRMLSRRGMGYHSAETLINIAMLKRSGLCPDLPGRQPHRPKPEKQPQTA